MDAKSVRNMYSIIAVTNKHTGKLHHVGSLYILEVIKVYFLKQKIEIKFFSLVRWEGHILRSKSLKIQIKEQEHEPSYAVGKTA